MWIAAIILFACGVTDAEISPPDELPVPDVVPPGGATLYTRVSEAPPAWRPAPRQARAPSDALVVRDCYGGQSDMSISYGAGGLGMRGSGVGGGGASNGIGGLGTNGQGKGGSGTGSVVRPAPAPSPTARPAPKPPKAPSSPAKPSAKKDAAPSPDASAPAASPPVVQATVPREKGAESAASAASEPVMSGEGGPRPMDQADGLVQPDPSGRAELAKEERKVVTEADVRRGDLDDEAEYAKPLAPVWDWGATVYLSNDDSMSLASAQRVLWALDKGAPVPMQHLRPHELLNYFSFDTAPVAEGQTFSVLGGAVQEGETLSVALAVRGAVIERAPLDMTLVVDRSGSMAAEGRMSYTKRALNLAREQLQSGDRVDLVLFDGEVCTPLENFVVGRDDPAILEREIARMQPRGSTDLNAGLREAFRVQRAHTDAEQRAKRVVLVTDAMLNTGDVDEDLVSEVGRSFSQENIRLTGVGVGREFNDLMLDKLTEKGKGAYVYLGSEAVVDRLFGPGFESLVSTVAHDVRFSIKLPASLAMQKFYGEESSTNPEDVQPINYYANTTQLFLQDLHVDTARVSPTDVVSFEAVWRDPVSDEAKNARFTTTVGALLEGDSRNVHKAQALMAFTDELQAQAMGGRACGAAASRFGQRAASVSDDAEVGYVAGLLAKRCPSVQPVTVAQHRSGVGYKLKLDMDQPIAEVQLACSGTTQKVRLKAGTSVVSFADAYPGACEVLLVGAVPMRVAVTVPKTGGETRCVVRGGRASCGG